MTDGQGLNITVVSYLDRLDFGFIVDRELIPDLWDLADMHIDEITRLFDATGAEWAQPPQPAFPRRGPIKPAQTAAAVEQPTTNSTAMAAATKRPATKRSATKRTATKRAATKRPATKQTSAARRPSAKRAAADGDRGPKASILTAPVRTTGLADSIGAVHAAPVVIDRRSVPGRGRELEDTTRLSHRG